MQSFLSLYKCWVFVSLIIILFAVCKSAEGKNFEEDTNLTAKEKKLLDEFKDRVIGRLPHDYMKEDIYLIKWLRNQDFDVEAAEKKLMNNLKWRQQQRMDTIHQEDWSDMSALFKYSLEGRDKFGRSILYFDVGSLDIRRSLIQGQADRLDRYVVKGIDEACGLVRTLGNKYKNITRGHLIVNIQGYNLVQHGCLRCLPFLLRLIPSYEDHYPECADQIILLNTPAIFGTLLKAGLPLFSRETRESLRIYGTNKETWKAAMSKDFDFDKLPRTIGGTMIYDGFDE